MEQMSIFQIFLSISVIPMIYACYLSDKIKNKNNAKRIMNKKIK